MFHHLHDEKRHIKSQGSINADNLHRLLENLNKKKILNPAEFIDRVNNQKLKKDEICLSFDDGLKSQFEIAAPVLDHHKIKAFFFIYTKFNSKRLNIEVLRYFREKYFINIENYYLNFFKIFENLSGQKKNDLIKKNKTHIKEFSRKFKFYTINDILYRKIRDSDQTFNGFIETNKILFKQKKFVYKKFINKLYMNKKNLLSLNNSGHNIGLHSHTHPTNFKDLNFKEQFYEFSKNKVILEKITKKKVNSASYPCGSFNKNTKTILKKLNIDISFTQIQNKNYSKNNINKYEIPRIDHTYLKDLTI
jgi:peptidoglycan/xylan/chitin deacetylase (PgdA/CDA1 family)